MIECKWRASVVMAGWTSAKKLCDLRWICSKRLSTSIMTIHNIYMLSAIAALFFMLTVQLPLQKALAEGNSNAVYHIFVRSFCDSDEPESAEASGDLAGITSRFDSYLNDGDPATDHDLEVGVLWLMPIFPADSYHGYNVQNYEDIHPDYGTLADFDELIQAAHDRGVKVILDIPFNHTSSNHPWFQQALAGDADMRKRYFFRDGSQPLSGGWHEASIDGGAAQYFGLFDRSMPDLNFEEFDVRGAVKEIAKFWLDRGVDGFRLDAAKHIFGDTFGQLSEPQILRNNDWWLEFSNFCYSVSPKAILVGEVLGGEEALRRHTYGLEALLDEPFMHEARNHAAFPMPGFLGRVKSRTRDARAINTLAPHNPDRQFHYFPFLGSHDENPRLASHLEELRLHGMPATVDQAYRVVTYLLLTTGNMPIIYNGDELMQRGWKWNGSGDGSGIFDETLREPFPWHKSGNGPGQTRWFASRFDHPDDGVSVEEQRAPGGMLSLIFGLLNFRTRHATLANGEFGAVLTDTHDWTVFERVLCDGKLLVLINPTGTGKDYHFHAGWYPQYTNGKLLFWSNGGERTWEDRTGDAESISGKVFVPPYGLAVLEAP